MSELQKYEVLVDGEIMHQWRAAGDVIELHPAQARYYLPPHDRRLKPVADAGQKKGGQQK